MEINGQNIETKWIYEVGLLWKCPRCKICTASSEENLMKFHRYCGVCGLKMFKDDTEDLHK